MEGFTSIAGSVAPKTGLAGEIWSKQSTVMTEVQPNLDKTTLVQGNFAGYDGTVLKNATGAKCVVLRNMYSSIERTDGKFSDITNEISYITHGQVTVNVEPGDHPSILNPVFMETNGKATTDASKTATNAKFIQDKGNDVWIVELT